LCVFLSCVGVYVWVFVLCGCVCVGFVMCRCVYVWVGVLIMCTCIYCVVYFRLCIFILICCVSDSVRTTATERKLNCSNNNNNNNNIIMLLLFSSVPPSY
jgi:hypothetical protein